MLIKLRLAKGVTQEEVSESLGISNKTLSRWETGASSPDIDMIPALADYYEVSIDTLFGRRSLGPESGTDACRYLIEYLYALPANEQLIKAFEMTYSLILGTKDHKMNLSEVKIPSLFAYNGNHSRSLIASDAGLEFFVNSKELNMFVMLMQNEDDFKTILDSSDEYRHLFAFLGKPYAVKIITLLYSKNFPDKFTSEFISKKLDIPIDIVESLLNEAVKLNLLKVTSASLKSGDILLYSSYAPYSITSDRTILPMIALAYEQICDKEHRYFSLSKDPAKMLKEI